jgi:hypothetical protein
MEDFLKDQNFYVANQREVEVMKGALRKNLEDRLPRV